MKYRSNSHQTFSSENLSNNYISPYNSNYINSNEEIKQESYETNLLNGVDSNLNLLLSNLKNNDTPKGRIYYPLHSKMKSPMKVPSTNDITTELNLYDEFNSLLENNSYRSGKYISQGNSSHQNNNSLSNYSFPYGSKNQKNPTIIINNSNNYKQKNYNNNETNNKRINNRSYSNQNYIDNNININRINKDEKNMDYLFKKNQKSNNMNNKNRFVMNKNRSNQNISNNIKLIPNNINYSTSSTNNQLNQIMNQIQNLNMNNAQNKKDIYEFQQEYLKMQNKILSSIENLNLNSNSSNSTPPIQKNQNINFVNSKDEENFELKQKIKNILENTEKEKNELKINLNMKNAELNILKSENNNLALELGQYKTKIKEDENKIENLSKENKEMKGKLLVLEYQKKHINKENKINKEKLIGLQDDHEHLIKERDIYQKQKNILDNEIKIMKLNNEKIYNIKLNKKLNN